MSMSGPDAFDRPRVPLDDVLCTDELVGALDAAEAGRAELEQQVAERTRALSDANEALRQSGARLQLALSAARMGIWTWDVAADTQTRDANLNRLLGLEPVETKQPSGEFLEHIHPDDRKRVAGAFGACARRGHPIHLEFRIIRPDGAVRWLRHQGGFSGGPDVGPPHVAGASVDITDLMETEGALRRARKELEDRLAARTSELARQPHSRSHTSALELCELAERLAGRAVDAAESATTARTVQAAARVAVSAARAAVSVAQAVRSFDVSRFQAIEREWFEAAWTEVRRALVTAEEEQRRRISRELHDQMGQHCASLIIGMSALEAHLSEGSDAAGQLERLVQLAHRIDDDVHRIALELRPTALDDNGLHNTLLSLAEKWGERAKIVVDYSSQGLEGRRLPPDVETAVFRIVQEALTNVRKHAAARRVGLILTLRGDDLVVIVEDDGVGFDPEKALEEAAIAGRLGMRGMRERAVLVGGDLEVEATPGGGTTVFVRIPLRPDAGAPTDA
jgi:PAS domain S-box-containing protein